MSRHPLQTVVPLAIKSIVELSPRLRAAAAGLALMAALGIVLAALAFTGPVVELVRPGSGRVSGTASATGQSMTFSYSASVPRTPAYDGTTASSPDPIFRKLARMVDLRYVYRGSPGSVAVDAKLTNGSGWHTTVTLAPLTAFAANHYDGVIHLDLGKLEARANAAAKAIGVSPGSLSVAVSAHVTTAEAPAFTPTLRLALTPLQLTLPDGEGSLAVEARSAHATPATTRPRRVSILGITLMSATTAQQWSIFLLAGGLLGAAGIALVARRNASAWGDAEIHLRYSPLLVPVEPMATAPGNLIVNVNEFEPLARLAERCGLLILYWARADSQTFVVRDQGITYRYRADIPVDNESFAVIDGGSEPAPPELPAAAIPTRTGGRRRAAAGEGRHRA